MTISREPHVVVLGAGQSGIQLADSLRQEGYAGCLTVVGDEQALPYQRPPLSKDYLASMPEATALPIRPESFYEAERIELIRATRGIDLDRRSKLLHLGDGRSLSYTILVFATGAAPRRLTLPGHDLRGVHELRTLEDAELLRRELVAARSAVVIGAGFVGLEFAAAARNRGLKVTVLEASDRVLGRAISTPMSDHLRRSHLAAGTTVHTGVTVEKLVAGTHGQVTAVAATTASHPADLVIVGIGARPRDELATRAGLATADGILVDQSLRTEDPAVFAVGDCARFLTAEGKRVRLESVQNATDQGRHVARAIMGRPGNYAPVPWFWSNQGTQRLKIAGLAGPECSAVVHGDVEDGRFSVYRFLGDNLVAVESLNQPSDHVAARRVLAEGRRPLPGEVGEAGFNLKAYAGQVVSTSARPRGHR
jgi:3-phenylpropionate/trans-cinnamate dioxygenase ferredoxin reductase subunit